ncbi:MAG: phage tail spike protein [Lachnospiraceae bacterium]|nr:phage tail spike protein [Lachnospiraceae bacterium]
MIEKINLYDATNRACNPIVKFSSPTIIETLNTVYTIEFEVPISEAGEIVIEGFLECDDKRFTIKEITQHLESGVISVYGVGDCDGLKYTRVRNFSVRKATVGTALNTLLNGRNTGWTWSYGLDEKPTAKRTLSLTKSDAGSVWAIIQKIIEKWNVEIRFDCVNHRLIVYKSKRLGRQSALTVFYEDLNLNDFERTSNSDNVLNEIIAYGKKDLTIIGAVRDDGTRCEVKYVNEVNDLGKPIPSIPKKMRGYYLDTQEDDPQELYDAAVAYLEKHCYPERNYTINVSDLSAINPDYSEFYKVSLGDTIGISSNSLDVRYNLRVVKITRKPNEIGSMELELTNKKASTATSTARERRIVNSMIDSFNVPVVGDTILVGEEVIAEQNIADNSVSTNKIQENSVTSGKLAEEAVTTLIDSSVAGVQKNLSSAPGGKLQIIYEGNTPVGFKLIDALHEERCWVWDYGGLRYSDDGGTTFLNVAIDFKGNIVASNLISGTVLTDLITAQNLVVSGGKIGGFNILNDRLLRVDSDGNILLMLDAGDNPGIGYMTKDGTTWGSLKWDTESINSGKLEFYKHNSDGSSAYESFGDGEVVLVESKQEGGDRKATTYKVGEITSGPAPFKINGKQLSYEGHDHAIKEKFIVTEVSTASLSTDASTTASSKILNIGEPGYYPLGIVGVNLTGTNFMYVNLFNYYLSAQSNGSGTITYRYRNNSSATFSGTIKFKVLWVKTT